MHPLLQVKTTPGLLTELQYWRITSLVKACRKFTCSRVLEATTRPFLRMECQFSMCEPLKHRGGEGKSKIKNQWPFYGVSIQQVMVPSQSSGFPSQVSCSELSSANSQLLKEDAFLPTHFWKTKWGTQPPKH